MTTFPLVAIIVATCFCLPEAVVDHFSTNAICRKHNCVNPVFPGLQDVKGLKASSWTCSSEDARQYLKFCAEAVHYNMSLPEATGANSSVKERVVQQEEAASTAYFYHLAGMNLEAWDYRNPQEHDQCVQSIWKMVCNTYFPKAPAYCKADKSVKYQLPCQNVCRNYQTACAVECCDESVQCVLDEGVSFKAPYNDFQGYSQHDAPSAFCTGSGARRGAGFSFPALFVLGLFGLAAPTGTGVRDAAAAPAGTRSSTLLLGAALAVVALSIQGCDFEGATLSAWEQRPSYLLSSSYAVTINDGQAAQQPRAQAVLNSCEVPGLLDSQKCSGNGICKNFAEGKSSMSFCECGRDWAGPECYMQRKSQMTAFLLSLFTGFLGVDRFYLGEVSSAMLKMSTLGGCGIWWVWDVVRIGSAPIYTRTNGRLAADLPHWLFVIMAVCWAALLGYLVFGVLGFLLHESRVLRGALLQAERINHNLMKQRSQPSSPEDTLGMPTRTSYRIMAPPPGPEDYYGTMHAASPQVKLAAYKNPMSSFFNYAKASEDLVLKSSGAFQRPTAMPPPVRQDDSVF